MSSQTVYFTNPAVIANLVNNDTQFSSQIQSMSGAIANLKWNVVTSQNWTAQSNTNYIWNLADTRSTVVGSAIVTFPAAPNDGDFIEILDGLGTWGNCLYTNIGLNMNGKALVGMTATGTVTTTSCQGGFRDYRKGSVLFTYNSSSNTWFANGSVGTSMSTEYAEVANETIDPWTGWWMFTTQTVSLFTGITGKVGTQTLNNGQRNASLTYAYIDATTYPISVTLYSNYYDDPSAAGAVYARCFEYYTTGSVVDTTTLVHINSAVGSQANVPSTKYFAGAINNTQGGGFRLQSDRTVCTVTFNSLIPNFNAKVDNQEAIMKKLLSRPGYTQKAPVESKMNRFNNSFDYAGQNYDDPRVMFREMMQTAIYDSNPQTQQSASGSNRFQYQNDDGYYLGNTGPYGFAPGTMAALQLLETFLSPEGFTVTTPIHAIVKSYSGPTVSQPGGGSTELTTVFTKGCPFVARGANVTIAGLTGTWATLNGYYPNGVSVSEGISFNQRKFCYSDHMDLEQTNGNYTGTLTYMFNRFNLIKDTHNIISDINETGPFKNFATNFGSSGTVSATYKVYATMPYNEFIAALEAFSKYVWGDITHTGDRSIYVEKATGAANVGRLATNWHMLYPGASNPLYTIESGATTMRNGGNTPSSEYVNYSQRYKNDPYQIVDAVYNQIIAPNPSQQISNLPMVVQNYLTGAKSLWVGLDGIDTTKPFAYSSYTGYYDQAGSALRLRNISYTGYTGGTKFISKLFNWGCVPTGAGPFDSNPDWRYWTPYFTSAQPTGVQSAIENARNVQTLYVCGLIKPEYTVFTGYPGWSGATGPRKVGYFYTNRTEIFFGNLPYTSPFAPAIDPSNPTGPYDVKLATGTNKPFSAAITQIYSAVFQYLVKELQCDCIILDERFNIGGRGTEGIEISEFFGGDRNGSKVFLRRPDNGFGALQDPDNYTWPLNAVTILNAANQRLNVSTNEINYPGCVFRGTGTSYTDAKKLVMLVGAGSLSNGSRFQRNFFGDNFDKKLGNNTIVKFIGSTDSRFQGTSTTVGYTDIPPQFDSGYTPTQLYATMNIETPTYGLVCQYIPTGSTGTLWYTKEYPGITSVDQPKNGFIGNAQGTGSKCLPEAYQYTLYPDFGAYTGAYQEQAERYPNLYLPGKTAELDATFGVGNWPVTTNYRTWRDSWLETAIFEAVVPVLPGEN